MAERSKQEIKRLFVLNGEGQLGEYGVGLPVWDKNERIVTKIIDMSDIYDNHTDFIFEVWAGEQLIGKVINCPVDIRYN